MVSPPKRASPTRVAPAEVQPAERQVDLLPVPDAPKAADAVGVADAEAVLAAALPTDGSDEVLTLQVPETASPFRKIDYKVGPRDTLYDILTSYGVSGAEVQAVSRASRGVFNFSHLKAGDELTFELLSDPIELSSLRYPLRDDAYLYVVKDGDQFAAREEVLETEIKLASKSGEISNSLYEAAIRSGLEPALISAIADIFAWEIDFVRDIRTGDAFSVLYEQRYREGEYLGPGKVIAARFTNQGETVEAFAYTDENGEPTFTTRRAAACAKSSCARPSSTRASPAPSATAVSHPVLKRRVPHLGVDFAAPVGTPVRAVGEGTITHAGWKGASGKFIKLRHNSIHESGYAHLSRIARGIRRARKFTRGR